MRALSAEDAYLMRPDLKGFAPDDPGRDDAFVRCESLVACGRMVRSVAPDGGDRFTTTDLGRLALRVAIAIPAVTL